MIPPEHPKDLFKRQGAEKAGQWNMGRSSPIGLQERKWGVWSLSPHL